MHYCSSIATLIVVDYIEPKRNHLVPTLQPTFWKEQVSMRQQQWAGWVTVRQNDERTEGATTVAVCFRTIPSERDNTATDQPQGSKK